MAYSVYRLQVPSKDVHELSTALKFTAFPLSHGMDPSHFHKHKTPSLKPSAASRPKLDKPPSNGHVTSSSSMCDGREDGEEHTSTPPSPSHATMAGAEEEKECYDSTAFFVRETVTGEGREMLFFGDVEPGKPLAI